MLFVPYNYRDEGMLKQLCWLPLGLACSFAPSKKALLHAILMWSLTSIAHRIEACLQVLCPCWLHPCQAAATSCCRKLCEQLRHGALWSPTTTSSASCLSGMMWSSRLFQSTALALASNLPLMRPSNQRVCSPHGTGILLQKMCLCRGRMAMQACFD